jgi:phosphoribosyl 1,2-cyclic phosphodiesterase
MVDPPLNSRGILQRSGVPSRLVDSVIITHCHADHDQGKENSEKILRIRNFAENFRRESN